MIAYILAAQPNVWDLRGLSTDAKPTDSSIGNGSTFFEIDTSKVYMFNQVSASWVLLA